MRGTGLAKRETGGCPWYPGDSVAAFRYAAEICWACGNDFAWPANSFCGPNAGQEPGAFEIVRGASLARMEASTMQCAHDPLYDINPLTGASIEVFYADRELETFGRCGAGWFWCARRRGFSPNGSPIGPVAYSYA